jgi:threonine synthase
MATADRRSPTGTAVNHILCRGCDKTFGMDLTTFPCPECGGILDPQYDYSSIDLTGKDIENRDGSMWKYRELLPVSNAEHIVSMGEGETPLIECPTLAEKMGIGRLLMKDEGQNPTNTFKDRGLSAAISMANEHGAETVGLPTAGNAGQSASAYAAKAGLNCHVFLNYQAGDVKKDLIEAHGAELHIREGTIDDAGAAFAEAKEENGWYTVTTFETPFRHEGKKTMGFEIYEALDWHTPDEIVYPTGGGVGLIGIWKGYKELAELGIVNDSPPSLTVAQTEGSSPVVDAIKAQKDRHDPVSDPNSIAKGVEIPDPGASPWILEAVRESRGDGVSVPDGAAVDAALQLAQSEGIEMCVTAGVALAGAIKRAERGMYDSDDTVVVTNCGAGVKTSARLGQAARYRPSSFDE